MTKLAKRYGYIIASLGLTLGVFGQLPVTLVPVRVNSMAQLIALSPPASKTVQTLGYTTQGDGGHGLYRWTNALPAGVVTNTGTWFAGSGGFWSLVNDGKVNVRQFGAKGDALANNTTIYVAGTDDTVAIQSTIDHCIINGGGVVHFPAATYRITSPILIQRADDTFARLGLTFDTNNDAYWADKPRIKIKGDDYASTVVCESGTGMFRIEGKATYAGYNNRIQHVTLEDMSVLEMDGNRPTYCFSVYNAGLIVFNRVRSRGSWISLKLSAVGESRFENCDFQNSNFGIWMERGNTVETAGDMANVFLNCNVWNQYNACVVAHYFRDIHFIGGGIGSRNPGLIAAVWLSCLSPTANSTFWIQDTWLETDKASPAPTFLIGSDGTEGLYSTGVYPFDTWTNSNVSISGVTIKNCYSDWTSLQGAVRVRGAQTSIGRGVQIDGTRFDSGSTPQIAVIETGVPDSVIVRYGLGNNPVDLIARTRDNRTNFLSSSVEANFGNLLNSGWRHMQKGGSHWIGSAVPITTVTNLTGPFGVDLEGGSSKTTWMPLWSGSSPFTATSNSVLQLDYAVHWPNSPYPGSAVRLYSTEAGTYYTLPSIGSVTEYAAYTNSWGVWQRYVAVVRPPNGVNIDRISFNNFDATNDTVALGYLALYSPTFAGDATTSVASGAAVWSGQMDHGDIQWSVSPSTANWFARKWTKGWAIRGAFSGATTYSRGTAISSSTNIYLATAAVSPGGAAPVHTSGIIDDWAFIATGSASTERRVATESASGTLTTTRIISTTGTFGGGTGNASAALDVASTTLGFLPPRMTTAQRDLIFTPANGLVIYNSTTNKLQVRAAGAWVDLH